MSEIERRRIEMIEETNSIKAERGKLEGEYGQVWDTEEFLRDFKVESFLAPFVFVTRKEDGIEGTLMFQHRPRFYFSFQPKRHVKERS